MPDPLTAKPWPSGEAPDAFQTCVVYSRGSCRVCAMERVIDGDTIEVNCGTSRLTVRLHGIDTPEIHGRQKCDLEGRLGLAAQKFVEQLVPRGHPVALWAVPNPDRYGRTLAMAIYKGRDIGADLVAQGLARPWSPGQPKINWCGE